MASKFIEKSSRGNDLFQTVDIEKGSNYKFGEDKINDWWDDVLYKTDSPLYEAVETPKSLRFLEKENEPPKRNFLSTHMKENHDELEVSSHLLVGAIPRVMGSTYTLLGHELPQVIPEAKKVGTVQIKVNSSPSRTHQERPTRAHARTLSDVSSDIRVCRKHSGSLGTTSEIKRNDDPAEILKEPVKSKLKAESEGGKLGKLKRKGAREYKYLSTTVGETSIRDKNSLGKKSESLIILKTKPEIDLPRLKSRKSFREKKTKPFKPKEVDSSSGDIEKPMGTEYRRLLGRYRLLGKSGLRVSPLCLGTINFGTKWPFMGEITKKMAEKIFEKYIGEGGNFIDTANKFQEGEAEEWLGEWIEERGIRDELVIASKYSLPLQNMSINSGGNHRKSMMQAIAGTLKRLRTDYIDIYYVHFWDFTTPPDELMQGLNDLVRSGKVHYIGISDCPAWQVAQLNTIAELRGWTRFVAYQGRYNFSERDLEREVIPMSMSLGLGVVPWGVFGLGKYTGKYRKGEEPPKESRLGIKMTDTDFNFMETIQQIAEEIHRSPAQVVLNWVINQYGITCPVVGCRTIEQLEENMGSLEFNLSQDHIDKIQDLSNFSIGFPHNFIGTSFHNSPWLKTAGTIDY